MLLVQHSGRRLSFYVSFLQGLTGARGYPGFPVGGCAFLIFFKSPQENIS